jgi:hypothetical protein
VFASLGLHHPLLGALKVGGKVVVVVAVVVTTVVHVTAVVVTVVIVKAVVVKVDEEEYLLLHGLRARECQSVG